MRYEENSYEPRPTPETIVYGVHPVEELLIKAKNRLDRIYFDNENTKGPAFELLKAARKEKIPCQCVPRVRLDAISGRDANHQGVIAICGERAYDEMSVLFTKLETKKNALILVPASCEDTRNLGAIIRSAAAFGVDAVMVERKNSAPLNAGTAKSAAGMLDHVTIIKPNSLEKELKDLREHHGFRILGADGAAEGFCYGEDLTGPTVIITGGEHEGIPPYLRRLCDGFIKVPMMADVESLNVSAAAAVLLYEVVRQRSV